MSKLGAATIAMLVGIAGVARADGFYYEESFGFAETHGDAHDYLSDAFHVRAGIGMRIGSWAIEPWIAEDRNIGDIDSTAMAAIQRGGPSGRVDLAAWGLDVKYLTPLIPSIPHLEVYVRGGANVLQPTGALEGYSGRGFGFGAGLQLKGKVRALGFLWTPLFFSHHGPMVTGAIFLDDGIDCYWVDRPGDPTLAIQVVHLNLGFAVGTDF